MIPPAVGYELVVDDRGNRNAHSPLAKLAPVPGSVLHVTQRIAPKLVEMYPGNKTNSVPMLFGDSYYWASLWGRFPTFHELGYWVLVLRLVSRD